MLMVGVNTPLLRLLIKTSKAKEVGYYNFCMYTGLRVERGGIPRFFFKIKKNSELSRDAQRDTRVINISEWCSVKQTSPAAVLYP